MGRKYTEEERKIINEKRRKTLIERYGDPHYNNMQKMHKTKIEKYGDINYNNPQKHEETCLEKYGVKHHNQTNKMREHLSEKKKSSEVQEKFEQTCLERYGQSNVNLVPEIREKRKNTLIEHYGVENPLQNKEIYEKHIQTMKENNSFKNSKNEEELYRTLCEKFGEKDVHRQYSDERYPFNCDFYVKSVDTFIEVNIHPSHYTHLFDPTNEDDILFLEELKTKNDNWSNLIIDVWSNRDYKKYQFVEKNNLRFVSIYPNSISMTKPCELLETPIDWQTIGQSAAKTYS